MTDALRLRAGFEIELLAPAGRSRADLAATLAADHGGTVSGTWHPDSEPSLVPGVGHFLTLTPGFDVVDADGAPLCALVDDLTLVDDLDAAAPPRPGWYRLLTDEPRLRALLARVCEPGSLLETVLAPVAALWGVPVEHHAGMTVVHDGTGATVAVAAPQGGGRERGCEVVTPPLARDHARRLERLLGAARAAGFTVPLEAAVHIHYDGALFRPAAVLANVVRLFGRGGDALRALLATNPRCRRIAPLPVELVAAAEGEPSLDRLREAAARAGLGKFHDVNLTQLLRADPLRDTLEVRVLPGTADTGEIVRRALLVERLLLRCIDPAPLPAPVNGVAYTPAELAALAGDRLLETA